MSWSLNQFWAFLQVCLGSLSCWKIMAQGGLVIKCKAALQVTLQNLDVKVPIHPPINLASISNPILQHTAPNHQRASFKLQGSFHQFITQNPLLSFSTPISCHLNPSDLSWLNLTKQPSSSPPNSSAGALYQNLTSPPHDVV